jgi:hypothetical protein
MRGPRRRRYTRCPLGRYCHAQYHAYELPPLCVHACVRALLGVRQIVIENSLTDDYW